MTNIELVIKIPEELYEAYKGRLPMFGDAGMDMIAQAISNGTPLPKGHGNLKDADNFFNDELNAKLAECKVEQNIFKDVVRVKGYN